MGSNVSSQQPQRQTTRPTVQTSQRQTQQIRHYQTQAHVGQGPNGNTWQTQQSQIVQSQALSSPMQQPQQLQQHQQVFQLPQVPNLPIMSPQRLSVFNNTLSIRINTVKFITDQLKHHIAFTFDTLVPVELQVDDLKLKQVYAFVTEQVDPITNLTAQCYNYLSMEKQVYAAPSKQQQFKSRFFIDFQKIAAVQLQTSGGFWPLIIRIESSDAQQATTKTIAYYYFIIEKDSNSYKLRFKKQKLENNFSAFEIQEIYGINESGLLQSEQSEQEAANISDQDKECIICFEEKIDTVIMPCRHMCICIQCAQLMQDRQKQQARNAHTNCCPVCRKEIESFIRIKQGS